MRAFRGCSREREIQGGRSKNALRLVLRTGLFAVLLLAGPFIESLRAQLPAARLHRLQPPGAQHGQTVEVTVGGSDLDEIRGVVFSHPGITGEIVTQPAGPFEKEPRRLPNRVRVKVAPETPSGLYEMRVVGRFGSSNPRAFMVSPFSEAFESKPADGGIQALNVGSLVNGVVGAATEVDPYKVPLKKGQRIFVECWGERIDSKLDAIVSLTDPLGREVRRSRGTVGSRDPLLDYTAALDGDYIVKIFDAIYGGSGDHFYRLAVHSSPRVDFVFPPAGIAGSTGKFLVYGRNLPGGQPAAGLAVDGEPLEQLSVDISLAVDPAAGVRVGAPRPFSSGLETLEYRLQSDAGESNGYLLTLTDEPVRLEAEPNDESPQRISVPCEFAGQFYPRYDIDTVEFEARKGESYWIEVLSERLGVPSDVAMVIQRVQRDKEGNETSTEMHVLDDLGANLGGTLYDTSTNDAGIRITVPENGIYRIVVHDQFNISVDDPRRIYRLSIRPPRPDFQLVALAPFPAVDPDPKKYVADIWSTLLRRGGTERIRVLAFRENGFNAPIELCLKGLPPGIDCAPVTLEGGQTSGTLILTAAEDAPQWNGVVRLQGRAKVGDQELVRYSRSGTVVWPAVANQTGVRSRLSENVVLAVTAAEQQPFSVEVGSARTAETTRGAKIKVPVRVKRRAEFNGNVVITPKGLPGNVTAKPVTVAGNATAGEIEFEVKNNAPIGQFFLQFDARAEVNYKRNPQAAAAAAAFQAELAKMAADLNAKAEAAKNEAAAKAKAAEELGKKAKELADQLAALQKAAKEANEQSKAAATAKTELEKQSSELTAKAGQATKAKETADKRATDTAKANEPAKLKVEFPVPPVRLTIRGSPINLFVRSKSVRVKQGNVLQLPIELLRHAGFDGPIEITSEPPGGAKGLTAKTITIPQGRTRGVLTWKIAFDAPPGDHKVTVKAKVKFNGQDLQEARTFTLSVQKYEAAKQAF